MPGNFSGLFSIGLVITTFLAIDQVIREKHLHAVGLTESGRASNHPGGPLTVDLLLMKKRNSVGSQAPAKLSPEYLQRNRPRSLL